MIWGFWLLGQGYDELFCRIGSYFNILKLYFMGQVRLQVDYGLLFFRIFIEGKSKELFSFCLFVNLKVKIN